MSGHTRADGAGVAAGAGAPANEEPSRILASVDGALGDARDALIPAYDDGLLRGDGAFEFLRVYAGRPFGLDEHLERMERTCATLRLDFPRARLEEELAALLAWAGPLSRDLRIVLTRGGRRLLFLEPSHERPPTRLVFVTDSPRDMLLGAKSLSYAGNMVARRTAEERGFDEALLTTADGRVMEIQQASFFWVDEDGALCTPPLDEGILDSITRRIIMRRLDVTERTCRTDDALRAREAFAAGAAREVQAVEAIEGRVFDEVPGPVTQRAVAAYRREVEEQLGLSGEQLWSGR